MTVTLGRTMTVPNLTPREKEVLRAWLFASTKEEAAKKLFVSPSTVNTHISRIRLKYEAVGRTAKTKSTLMYRAIQDGLVHLDELG